MRQDRGTPKGDLERSSARCFRRREEKYELGLAASAFLRQEIARRLPLFAYMEGHQHTHITTIYFDTAARDFYHRAELHHDHNLKIRVKEYYYLCPEPGDAGARMPQIEAPQCLTSPHCYVEIKERLHGSVIKKRFGFPKEQLKRLFDGHDLWPVLVRRTPPGEIEPLHEIYREFKRYISFYPVAVTSVVNYRRTVYQRVEDDLRITFDDQLAVFAPYRDLYDHDQALTPEVLGKPIRATDKVILEIKCPDQYPEWLAMALKYHSTKRLSKFTTSVRLLLGESGAVPQGSQLEPGLSREEPRPTPEDETKLSTDVFY